MGTSQKLFNRERTVHQILGGGIFADVLLWRKSDLTIGILIVTLGVWLVFEKSGYTLVSLVSNVLLLLISIIFLWAKAAAILNRPPPPLPDLYFSEEIVNDVASFLRDNANTLLSRSKEIAMGKDTKMFLKVASYLLLISIIGGLTDFVTLGYIGLVVLLTIPAFYEKYEDHIDRYVLTAFKKLQELYQRFDAEIIGNWIVETKKSC